jgi:hypothetical protein
MRTTIRVNDELLREAKIAAAEDGKTLTELVEDALRERLARRGAVPASRRVSLPTFKGTGLLPGVDLDDSAGLLDLMEQRSAAP